MKKYIIILLAALTLACNPGIAQIKPIKRPKSNNSKTEQTTKQKQSKKQKQSSNATKQQASKAPRPTKNENQDGPTMYDKPIINMKDIKDKVENDYYMAFLDNNGKVVGFDKKNRKYFTIYVGKNDPATKIRINDNNTLLVKTVNSHSILYDLIWGKNIWDRPDKPIDD